MYMEQQDKKAIKKLLILYGSPHKNGNTDVLLNEFLRHFPEKDWEYVRFDAYKMKVKPCIACDICSFEERCVYDDMDVFDKEFRESDAIVIATPVYNYSFPAPLKSIFDRTQRYFNARFSLGIKPSVKKHRKAALLLTMGSDDSFGIEVIKYQLERIFSVMNTELIGYTVWEKTDRGNKNNEDVIERTMTLALEMQEKT